MKVFESFVKIMRRHIHKALIYIIISLVIITGMTLTASDSKKGFSDTKLKISVTDCDNSDASRAVVDYIRSNHKIVEVGETKDERLDALYFMNADVILTIEEGFGEKLENGETEGLFSEYSVVETYTSVLFDSQLNRYITMVSAGIAGGETAVEASHNAAEALSEEVETVMKNDSSNVTGHKMVQYYFFTYLAYIILSVLLVALAPVILTINRRDIRRRIDCSSNPPVSRLMQIALGTLVFVIGIYLLFMAAGAVLFGSEMFTKQGLLLILNSAVFTVAAMMICLFITSLSPSMNSMSMIANVVGLGMSFLCGVFVPQRFLGDAALGIGRMLPAYWYVRACNIIMSNDGMVYSSKGILTCIGIQIAFAAALFCATLVITKTKRQSEE